MKNHLMRLTDKLLARKRAIVETVIDQLRGCLKRAGPGIVRRQETAKILSFLAIILLHRYSLRLSLAFQTTSQEHLPD
jgi:hypothetical protein